MDIGYLGIFIISLILGFGTQAYIKSAYKKYSKIGVETRMTGAQTARRMLDANGLTHVQVREVGGTLSDHYDPRTQVVSLSSDVYHSYSVAATAIACHECGHAVQHATSYAPLSIRTALVPVANFGSKVWVFLLIAGIFLNIIGLFYLAIILFAFSVLFQLVTLPVEFNASHRGMDFIKSGVGCGIAMSGQTVSGARTVLTAAALTYVAAALVSVLQLLYYIGLARD